MPTTTTGLPADLAALPRQDKAPLAVVSVRLDSEMLAEMTALSEQLGNPTRAALIRCLIQRGIASAREQMISANP